MRKEQEGGGGIEDFPGRGVLHDLPFSFRLPLCQAEQPAQCDWGLAEVELELELPGVAVGLEQRQARRQSQALFGEFRPPQLSKLSG